MYRPAVARSLYKALGRLHRQFSKHSVLVVSSGEWNVSIPSQVSQCFYSVQTNTNSKGDDSKSAKLTTVDDVFNALPLKEEINYSMWVLNALTDLPKTERANALKDPKFHQIIQYLQDNLQSFAPPDIARCLKHLMKLYPNEDPEVIKNMEEQIQKMESRMSVNQLYELLLSHRDCQTSDLRKETYKLAREKLFLRWAEVNEPLVLTGMMFMAEDAVLENLETKAMQLIEKMSQQQLFSVLHFLCQRKRRNKPLIRAVVFHLNNKGKELLLGPTKLIHLARICAKLSIYDDVLLRRWSVAMCQYLLTDLQLSDFAISSLFWSINSLRWHDPTLIDAIVKNALASDNGPSTDLLTSMLAMCATVNYMPEQLKDSLPVLCKKLDETFMMDKCRSFLEIVWSLAVLQCLKESQLPIEFVLGPDFRNKLKASLPEAVYPAACIKLANINAEVKFNMKNYKGPFLPEDFLSSNSIQVPIRKHRPLVDKAATALANMYPIEKFIKLDVQSPLGYSIDIEMLLNSSGKPQPLNSSDSDLKKLAIKVLDFSEMTLNNEEPIGRFKMMERHLSEIGYKVVMIPHNEIAEPQTTVKQVRYMQQKLELSRPSTGK